MIERMVLTLGIGLALATPAAGQAVDLRDMGHLQGNPFAPVQVVEFADFGCSACGLFHRDSKARIVRDWIDTGRVGWRLIPIRLSNFRHSQQATIAAECAAAQDRLWPMEQLLYDRQREWQGQRRPDKHLRSYVERIGADPAKWEACYAALARRDPIAAHNRIARELAIRGTPTFFVNGQRVMGALPYDQFSSLLEEAEAAAFR